MIYLKKYCEVILLEKNIKLTRQVSGTMAMEGMILTKEELKIIHQCAEGKESSTAVINDLVKKYKVK